MKITSFALNNFAPEEFFGGGGAIRVDERSKILECDRTMKAFSFVERNNNKKFKKLKNRAFLKYHYDENRIFSPKPFLNINK